MEDKRKICELLLLVLQSTRALSDLDSITYHPYIERVAVRFRSGHCKSINVEGDSGITMIFDIVSQLI